jgi:hypothetical protein
VSPYWSQALEVAGRHLLTALAAGTAGVCLLSALVLLRDRMAPADAPEGAYYVGRRDAAGLTVYFVGYHHIARLAHAGAPALPAWGPGGHTERLAAVMLCHRTGRRHPPERQVAALALWLEDQPSDGFVLEAADLDRMVGAPFAGRRRLQTNDRAPLRAR